MSNLTKKISLIIGAIVIISPFWNQAHSWNSCRSIYISALKERAKHTNWPDGFMDRLPAHATAYCNGSRSVNSI